MKSLKGQLVSRADTLEKVIEAGKKELISRHIVDLRNNDSFIKAWISVITMQTRPDKRKRKEHDLPQLVIDTVEIMRPILIRKKINVKVVHNGDHFERRVFPIDIESIIYNLIINSIEAFESSSIEERCIEITLSTDEMFHCRYFDNGKGIDPVFEDPYDIFKFGTTSKVDSNGEKTGTGLGMYIVASTLREYNSEPKLIRWKDCFEMSFSIVR